MQYSIISNYLIAGLVLTKLVIASVLYYYLLAKELF